MDYAVYAPLATVKGLEHLTLMNGTGKIPHEVQRSILGNSAETLRSLTMDFRSHGNVAFVFKGVVLPNLQCLGLSYFRESDDADMIDSLFTTIDFPKLTKLVVHLLPIDVWDRLTKAFLETLPEGVQPRLRSLVVRMNFFIGPLSEWPAAEWDATIRFIASFDTLTTLIIPNSGHYREGTDLDPALPTAQLEAILKHKDLETLDVSHTEIQRGFRSMFQSAETIRAIVSGLPQLRVLKIAPAEGQMVCIIPRQLVPSHIYKTNIVFELLLTSNYQAEVAKALANCANLDSVTIIRGASAPLLVLPAFLMHSSWPRDRVSRSGKFVWEEHYRLRSISNGRNVWQIGSSPGTGSGNVERLTNGEVGEAKREVFARDISGRVADCDVESRRQFEWVDAVAKDTSWVANGEIGSLDFEYIHGSRSSSWESYIPTAL